MGKVISSENLTKHHIKKFQFTSLGIKEEKNSFDHTLFSQNNNKEEENITEEINADKVATMQDNSVSSSKKEADTLLQKIETLTNQNISIEMELETLKKELNEKIEEATKKAYEQGHKEGVKETQETLQEHNDTLNMQLVKSVTLLDEQVQKVDSFLSDIKEELIGAASIIAKKVIKKELETHSHEVAKSLAQEFLQDLKEATAITLKVNPEDASYLNKEFKAEKNIKIDPDDAINKGGIIILSDIGNIDGNIDTRVEKAIALIKREG